MTMFCRRIYIALALGALLAACEGPAGAAGGPCSVSRPDGGGSTTISCPGSTDVVIPDPTSSGGDGGTCTVEDVDGGRALTCNGVTSVIPDPCTIVNDGAGTTTITCPGADPFVITDTAAVPCTVVADADAGTATVSCPGSDDLVIDTTPGVTCSVSTATDGSQTLNCSDGTSTALAGAPTHLTRFEQTPGLVLNVTGVAGGSGAGGAFASGDFIQVTFTLADDAGHPVPLASVSGTNIWFAGPTSNYQHIIPTSITAKTLTNVKSTAVANADGSYTYTFTEAIPANYGGPLFDTTTYTDGELTGPLMAGTYTIAMNVTKNYMVDGRSVRDASSLTRDVLFGSATTLEPRDVVGTENCNGCHSAVEGHGARYNGTNLCVTCHTSGAETPEHDATIDFRVMIHKIHNGSHLPSVLGIGTATDGSRTYATTGTPYTVHGPSHDFSGIIFPMMPNFQIAMPKNTGYSALTRTTVAGQTTPHQQAANDAVRKGVTACATCHGDPDGAGAATAPADGDNAYNTLTRRACGSCHDDLDYTRPYTQNGETMQANRTEATCSGCHTETALQSAHRHPLTDPAIAPENVMTVTGVTGGSGTAGAFAAGDSPTVAFTITNGAANVPITSFDGVSLGITGPTTARQVVWAGALTASPYDFAGRLQSASTTNKGSMGKVFGTGTPVSEALTVGFTSSTAFTVAGLTTGDLGGGTLAAAASTTSSGTTVTNFALSSAAVARELTLAFTSPVAFTVSAGATVIGSGTLPNAINAVTRFTSTDSTVAFNVTVGTTANVAGNNLQLAIVKGTSANPVLFAIAAGRTAFAAGDRFYYDFTAPAATYTTKIPMDLTMERLGASTGVAGEAFAAANLPVWYGRQTLFERTALVGAPTTLTSANRLLATWLYVGSTTGLAANDYVVLDAGTATEEYAQVSAVSATNRTVTLVRSRGLRYTHAVGATLQEVTLAFRQEGTDYTLNPTTGVVTITAAPAAGNVFVMNYRTDGRFGWKRAPGDTRQDTYYTPADLLQGTDETWGDWRGKPFVAGTYTVALWGYGNIELALHGEHQIYRGTTRSSQLDVLYGAGTLAPYSIIEVSSTNDPCAACHGNLRFHGGSRRGGETCMVCHANPGGQVNYATILHEFHAEALPVMPNGAAACATCHGTSNTWEDPTDHSHPTAQTLPARRWGQACTGCHSSAPAVAHVDAQTSSSGGESCETCHGATGDFPVDVMHQAR